MARGGTHAPHSGAAALVCGMSDALKQTRQPITLDMLLPPVGVEFADWSAPNLTC